MLLVSAGCCWDSDSFLRCVLTRARLAIWVVGDSRSLSRGTLERDFFEYCERSGRVVDSELILRVSAVNNATKQDVVLERTGKDGRARHDGVLDRTGKDGRGTDSPPRSTSDGGADRGGESAGKEKDVGGRDLEISSGVEIRGGKILSSDVERFLGGGDSSDEFAGENSLTAFLWRRG